MSDGARALQSECAVMRRNLSRSCRMSFWHLAVRQSEHCNRLPIPCRSCSRPWPTRWAQVLSRASRDRAATSPDFMLLEYSIGTKWLEMLKEVAPSVTRVAVVRDPTLASGSGQFGAIQGVASSFGVELTPVGMRDPKEIESTVNAFARGANGGLIVTASTLATLHRELIVAVAFRHRLPAVYSNRLFVTSGGLLSYSSLTASTSFGRRPVTSTASSRARSPQTCRCSRRQSMSW